METQTHWRKGDPSDYLMSWDVEGELHATIIKVEKKNTKIRGQEKLCRIAYFKESNLKPMIINVVNGKIIEKALGSFHIEKWANVNIPVILFVDENTKFGKEVTRGLRFKLGAKPSLVSGTKAYDNAITHIREGNSFDRIEAVYTVSNDVKKAIEEAVNGVG